MTENDAILVTGAAGFIGYHVSERLLADGKSVIGFDCISDYYDVRLKEARLARLITKAKFKFVRGDLANAPALQKLFQDYPIRRVINLAAQAGVRYSLTHPQVYISSNLTGFANILECCRLSKIEHLVYASSSSVYGGNTKLPFSIHDNADHPVSLYAATKKANELIAHSYAHLFQLPCTGLRFFSVYGPWGRPDMAALVFAKAILAGEPIDVYNEGRMKRDFTYIDDIVEGVVRVLERVPAANPNWNSHTPDPGTSNAPWRVYNIGNNQSHELLYFIEILEKELGRKAIKRMLPMQPGDVSATVADVDDLMRDTGFAPKTPLETGLKRLIQWYREYYKV